MKHTYLILLPIIILNVIFSSCECVNPICYKPVQFSIVDKTTSQDLIFGPNPIYFIDTILTRTNYDTIFNRLDREGTYNGNPRLYLPIGDTVFIKLNQNDIDTVLVNYTQNGKAECCPNGYFVSSAVQFNGTNSSFDGTKYIFKK